MDIITKCFLIAGIVMSFVWIVLYMANIYRFDDEIASIPADEYVLKDSLIFGFAVLRLTRFNVEQPKYVEAIKKFSNLYGIRYARYFFFVARASEISWCWLSVTLGLLISGIFNVKELFILAVVIAIIGVVYRQTEVYDKLNSRENELICQFPSVVSKMTLLVGAGLTMREAWREVASSGTGELYKEMRMVVSDKENGATDEDAFGCFGDRCKVREIRRFAMSTVQNMQKGNSEQVEFLKDMSSEMWEVKKKLVKKRVEDMKTLLLVPTFMVFIGILIMVIGPMLLGMGSLF